MVFRGELESGTPGVLALEERADPVPGAGEILIRVAVCGVCRTDLDLVDGRLAPAHLPVVPGHQVVGRIAALGPGVTDSRVGERVGVAWIHSACGVCRWCTSGCENLCPDFVSTGCGHDGGYADLLTVPAGFVHPLPDDLDDLRAAPLLCAGAVGWRALRLTALTDGEPLGLTGFGASAHLVLQLARRRHPRSPIYVFARHPEERRFALELGATWAGPSAERAPRACAAIIDTTPAWTPVVDALGQLAPGGRLV
ncbi:MAG TPA: alcohol dehydrogenase catalytic domain-containing protein, partial [Gemmatimonadaceae bacterium]|nr:alcohol dehydrogenase catalytic domain-containing protein [Gemmatimonadaceae bacterium]